MNAIHDSLAKSEPSLPRRLAPNPLWAITIGMGVFFAVAAALFAPW